MGQTAPTPKEVSDYLIDKLRWKGFTIQSYSINGTKLNHASSRCITLDYGLMGSIRISDREINDKYSYIYNVVIDYPKDFDIKTSSSGSSKSIMRFYSEKGLFKLLNDIVDYRNKMFSQKSLSGYYEEVKLAKKKEESKQKRFKKVIYDFTNGLYNITQCDSMNMEDMENFVFTSAKENLM